MRLKLAVIFLLLSSVSTYAQEWVTMSGVVTDKRNTPMVGVIILENGVQTGVMTNAKGKYSITTTPGATIEFKFLGYKTEKKKAVEGEENIKIAKDVYKKSDNKKIFLQNRKQGSLSYCRIIYKTYTQLYP